MTTGSAPRTATRSLVLDRDRPHTLIARLDGAGDVLLAGPAVRAVVAGSRRVSLLVSRQGREAAGLLPGVDRVLCFDAPWVLADPPSVDRRAIDRLVERLAADRVDRAVVLTSFHQSALPLALLLRMAGVAHVTAIAEDYPGSLLDVRVAPPGQVHEVERGLAVVDAAGFALPEDDDRRLAIRPVPAGLPASSGRRPGAADPGAAGVPNTAVDAGGRLADGYVVVHPGASVPARTWAPARFAEAVMALRVAGWPVVVTGGPLDRHLGRHVRGPHGPDVVDLTGRLDLAATASVLAGAAAVVVGNTGPAHLAAAVGTPVVSLFPPTVPAARWRPWGVDHVLLGDPGVPCAGCRARRCPHAGHPCLAEVTAGDVVAAVARLAGSPPPRWAEAGPRRREVAS